MLNFFNVYTHNLVLIVILIYAPTFQRKTDTDNISLSLTNNQTHKYTIYLNKWLEVRYISYCSFCIFIPLSIRWSERVVVVVVIPIGWILSAVIRIQSRGREKKITHWANVRSVQVLSLEFGPGMPFVHLLHDNIYSWQGTNQIYTFILLLPQD